MKVVILCGGYGTRIRGVADDLPKPMISVGGRPILWHIMKYYAAFSHSDFVLCLGYKGNVIKDYFMNYESHTCDVKLTLGDRRSVQFINSHSESDWKITLAETGRDSMTGARIKRIEKYIEEDVFMLTYGDGLGDINIDALIAFHHSHGKAITVSGVNPPGRFGELLYDRTQRVTGFNEKPQVAGGRISGGFFVCNRNVFDYLNDDVSLIFEREPLEKMVRDQQMMVYEHDGFWQPMDTHREYLLLNDLQQSGQAPWIKRMQNKLVGARPRVENLELVK
ncbi:MAG: glucose-1-phosphate cytidylyltransferase [Gammaproteobacteria bacterium]|nr:glucose-1-phosphate cytidylyltransferase [Gammaproteobacteria bacterium]